MINKVDIVYDIQDFDKNLIKIDGNGRKRLLIVLNNKNLNEEDWGMLEKMMAAIQYDFEDDLYKINLGETNNLNISTLGLDFKNIIVFGLHPKALGFNVPFQLYKPIVFDSLWALMADDLQTIRTSPTKKQELWSVLKSKFLI